MSRSLASNFTYRLLSRKLYTVSKKNKDHRNFAIFSKRTASSRVFFCSVETSSGGRVPLCPFRFYSSQR
ncbi:MAG: hypothetical protein D6679_04780 [Candidatus Hydrogenedentota bacterium]|nr:MAG: hypothetical protein D6679_04780 [Candidatus Hydrogenedentota bacterium]